MPRDGQGTYTRTNGSFSGSTTWQQQAASADKVITDTRHDTHDQDIADALTGSVPRDGQAGMSGNLSIGNNRVVSLADGISLTDAVTVQQLTAAGTQNKDAAEIIWTPSPTGTEPRSAESVFNETISVLDFIDPAEHAAILDGTTTFDATTDIQEFITYIVTNARRGQMIGTYEISAAIDFPRSPGWALFGGEGRTTVIRQKTDNTPIFNLGSDDASQLNSWVIDGFEFTYTNVQPSGNTLANPILFSKEALQGRLANCRFSRGAYAIRTLAVPAPWGTTWDNLVFSSGLTLGAMDWSLGQLGTPNNKWGRIFVDCENMEGPVFNIIGRNFVVDNIEFNNANKGPILIRTRTNTDAVFGAIKLENGTYLSGSAMFDFQGNSDIDLRQFLVHGDSMVLTPASGTLRAIQVGSGGTGDAKLRVGSVDVEASTLTGEVVVFQATGTSQIVVEHVTMQDGWTLQDTSATTTANNVTVGEWVNQRVSDDKGNQAYTVALGDPNIVMFETLFTQPRTMTLPAKGGNDLCNGLYFDIISAGAVNGANTLTIKEGTNTLEVLTTDPSRTRYTWRRQTWVKTIV